MQDISCYYEGFMKRLETTDFKRNPKSLYDPIDYIMSLGGKRIRPLLTLMGCEVFDVPYEKALPAAMAVEMFHNFSLVHDDIMDSAPLRRGKPTVHHKWDVNTGILSGDAMLILAYQHFEEYEPVIFQRLAKLFSKTALEVCEGQQFDVDFELRENVSIEEYLHMIEYKTAVLVGAAMKMGAIVAETTERNQDLLYRFGVNLGIAFQLQDDYLDAFGDPETFGKQVGGDIIENKKTYLYIKALEYAPKSEKEALMHMFSIFPEDPSGKVETVKEIFLNTGAGKAIQDAIIDYTQKAFETLNEMEISDEKKDLLRQFGENLMRRNV